MSEDILQAGICKIETTVGELIETVTQIALEAGKSEAEGYELASLALQQILQGKDVDLSSI